MTDLHSKVNTIINNNINNPQQGSIEWHAIKKITIGGSEVATVIGKNPYKKTAELVAEKVGLNEYKFNGNIATRWGNLFESITRVFTEIIFSTTIYETGSIQGPINRQRYSPDGLGIVNLKGQDNNIYEWLVLFEFKAPYKTIPDGIIPKQYIPQLQTGLMTIPDTEFAIFVNNMYRKCNIDNISFDAAYDTNFHSSDSKKLAKSEILEESLACGVICFYLTAEDVTILEKQNKILLKKFRSMIDPLDEMLDLDDTVLSSTPLLSTPLPSTPLHSTIVPISDTELSNTILDIVDDSAATKAHELNIDYNLLDIYNLSKNSDDIIDFGELDESIIGKLLKLIDEKKIFTYSGDMILNNSAVKKIPIIAEHKLIDDNVTLDVKDIITEQIQSFMQMSENNDDYTIGFMPWKLIKSDIIIEEKDVNWQEKIKEPIKQVITNIDTILNSENKSKTYRELYPNSKVPITELDADMDMADIDIVL